MVSNRVMIQIFYRSAASGSLIMQRGDFPLKGKKPESVAYEWWTNIQKEMFVAGLEQVIIDGEDKTDLIKKFN
jgi:hypothetical protein